MSQRFRILHCLRAPVGGLFRHVLDLSAEQTSRGHEVGLVVDSNASDPLTAQKLSAAAPTLTLGIARIPMSRLPGWGDIAAARAVREVARQKQVDVLHGHGAKGGAHARVAGWLMRLEGRKVATFYTPHGGSLHFPPGTGHAALYIGAEKVLARITDGLIFESDYIRRIYEERVGQKLAPSRVITNGLRPADFTTHTPAPDAADFLFVGELRRLKGVDVLLRALAEVSRVRPVRAIIVGEGPDREAFERLAADLRLKTSVTFTGALPATEVFSRARSIVVPSRAESLPFIVLEAAAAGLPLIPTNVGGIPEIVKGTDTRLLPPGDVGALVQAMHDFLDVPDAAKARARRLREVVAERFASATTTAAVLEFYGERLPR